MLFIFLCLTYVQNIHRVTDIETKLWLPGSKGGINWEIGIDIYIYTTIYKIEN